MSKTDRPEKPPRSAKRAQLLDTAWTLFCRHGYRAVGIDTVLAEAGVAKMTLYKHFASKEDLIAAVMEQKGAAILAGFDAVIAAAGTSPDQRLLGIFDWLAGWFATPDFSGCAFLKAVGEYTGAGDKPREVATAFKRAMQERIETLCVAAGLDGPALLARQLLLLVDGATLHADMHRGADYAADARAAAEALIEAARR